MKQILILSMLLSLNALSQNKEPIRGQKSLRAVGGGGNGGETIIINGKRVLRDTVDPTNCDWKSGKELWDTNPAYENIFAKLEKLNWYFAFDLKRRVLDSDYCLTQNLSKLFNEDFWGVHEFSEADYEQTGIVLYDIYLDKKHLSQMSRKGEALFVIHENIHSYISDYDDLHNNKVRSMGGTIDKVANNVMTSPKKFNQQLYKNIVDFPMGSPVMTSFKSQLIYILSSQEQRASLVTKQKNIYQFLEKLRQTPRLKDYSLYYSDVRAVNSFERQSYSHISLLCQAESLNHAKVSDPTLYLLCAEQILIKNDVSKKTLIEIQTPAITALESFNTKDIFIKAKRVYANDSLASLAIATTFSPEYRLLELSVPDLNSINVKLKGLWVYLAKLIDSKEFGIINEVFIKNERLERILSFEELKRQLQQKAILERELKYGLELLSEMEQNTRKGLFNILIDQTSYSQESLTRILKLK